MPSSRHWMYFAAIVTACAFAAPLHAQATVDLKPIFEVVVEKDVAYLAPERGEKADLYLPAKVVDASRAATLTKRPGMIIIHGGGWATGDKGAAREQNIGKTLASHGYVCMSINYLLQPKEGARIWPRNVHDCKTAVRWLRAQADRFQLDTDHIGVIGGSAGGHLALLLGLTDKSAGLDPDGPYGDQSCAVQAVIDLYGPIADTPKWTATLLGETATPELAAQVTPLTHVDAQDPPVLVMHGTADTTVDVRDSEVMFEALKKISPKHQLVIVSGAPHSFHLQPKQQDLRSIVLGFLDQHLKVNQPPKP